MIETTNPHLEVVSEEHNLHRALLDQYQLLTTLRSSLSPAAGRDLIRLLDRVELRTCYLILHYCPSQFPDYSRFLSRSRFLAHALNQSGGH